MAQRSSQVLILCAPSTAASTLQRKMALQTSWDILEWMCLNMVIPLAYLFLLLLSLDMESPPPSPPEQSRMVAKTSAVGLGPCEAALRLCFLRRWCRVEFEFPAAAVASCLKLRVEASAEELLSTAAMRTAAEGERGRCRCRSELREEQRLQRLSRSSDLCYCFKFCSVD